MPPELLLVDELSLGLAPVIVEDLMARVVQIRRDLGITIVIVEQSAAAALAVADYGYVLENGRVVLDGDSARAARARRHPGVLSRPVAAAASAQLPRGQAVSAQPEMVWLSLRSSDLRLRFGGLRCSTASRCAVERSEFLALIGPNGAGKTSVLNCVSGIYRGDGRDPLPRRRHRRPAPHEIARLGVARTFQHGELFPQMSVLDNLLTGRHARIRTNPLAEMLFLPGVRREEVAPSRRGRERSSNSSSLSAIATRRSARLPFGTQKIVGFARALALEPAVLLLDEPSAGLNREEREDLARFILRIKHELGIAMIWIEHDMQMVADLADRIHVLDYGRTLAEGPPEAVLKHPAVIEAYLGRAGTVAPSG